jgi:hypothetical protein
MPEEKKPNDDGKPVDQFLAETLEIMTAAGWVEQYGADPGNTAVEYTEHGKKALEALWLAFGDLFPHGLTRDTWWGAAFVATLKFGPPKE